MYLNDFYSPFVLFTNKNTPIITNITPAKADLLNSAPIKNTEYKYNNNALHTTIERTYPIFFVFVKA